MKYILVFFIFLNSCHTQKLTLQQEYRLAKTNINPIFHEVIPKFDRELFDSQGNGAAILLKAKIDTLESNNSYTNWERDEFETLGQDVWIATSQMEGNILIISLGQLFGNQFVQYEVSDGAIETKFWEIYQSDNVLKLARMDKPVNELVIPIEKCSVELSKTTGFKVGDVIYGKSTLLTKPYYLKPLSFDFEYIKREYEMFFKFKVR